MSTAAFLWEKVRKINQLPGAHAAYKAATRVLYRHGSTVTIRRGPGAGLLWRHYRDYQTWMAMGLYEPHVASLIVSLLAPGGVFYDIGANAGYYSLIASKIVGPDGRVIAFDPVPKNAETVREQIALNGFDERCKVERLAVSGASGSFSFVIDEVNANSHLSEHNVPHLKNTGQVIEVAAVTLDEYAAGNPRPALIKMDIEGAEVDALKGARELLSSADAPTCLISTHSDELERGVKEILAGHGYSFKNLEGFEQMVYAMPSRNQAM
jgi:FkbM family methyltransferase